MKDFQEMNKPICILGKRNYYSMIHPSEIVKLLENYFTSNEFSSLEKKQSVTKIKNLPQFIKIASLIFKSKFQENEWRKQFKITQKVEAILPKFERKLESVYLNKRNSDTQHSVFFLK